MAAKCINLGSSETSIFYYDLSTILGLRFVELHTADSVLAANISSPFTRFLFPGHYYFLKSIHIALAFPDFRRRQRSKTEKNPRTRNACKPP